MNMPTPSIADLEEAEARAESARLRFKQQVLLGIGGAMIFALVGAVGTTLLHTVVAGGITLAPVLGLAAIAAVGIGCLYFGSLYLTELIAHDQNAQARKICIESSKGLSQSVTPEISQPTVLPIFAGNQKDQAAEQPSTVVDGASIQREGRTTVPNPIMTAESWVDRTAANDTNAQLSRGA